MKVNRPFKFGNSDKKKKKKLYEEEDESSSKKANSSIGSWAETDPDKFNQLAEDSKRDSKRPPEMWVPDGQSRALRFIDNEPVAAFSVYRFKKNGKWVMYVKPAEGDVDLFASRLGLKASKVFLYRVIDIDGYTNKKGKTFTNIPRFLRAPIRMFETIRGLKEEIDDETELNKIVVKLRRSGTATNTTYQFLPKSPTPLTAEQKKVIADFPNWEDFYRPLSKAEQKAVIASMPAAESESDDEDTDE